MAKEKDETKRAALEALIRESPALVVDTLPKKKPTTPAIVSNRVAYSMRLKPEDIVKIKRFIYWNRLSPMDFHDLLLEKFFEGVDLEPIPTEREGR